MANEIMQSNSVSELSKIRKLPSYETTMFGVKLIINNSVLMEKCLETGEETITIPNTRGLLAAAALTRIKIPLRLEGKEIKFIRKAMKAAAKRIAAIMEVKVETVSRWENGKQLIGPSNEKLFRFIAYYELVDVAPAIEIKHEDIAEMRITSVRMPEENIILSFELVNFMKKEDKQVYEEYKLAA